MTNSLLNQNLPLLEAHDPWLATQVLRLPCTHPLPEQCDRAFSNEPTLYLSDFSHIKSAFDWLKDSKERHLILFETDPTLWKGLLDSELAEPCLSHKRVRVCGSFEKLKEWGWRFVKETYQMVPHTESVAQVLEGIQLSCSLYIDHHLSTVNNTLLNLSHPWVDGLTLAGHHTDRTAVVCGNGPSLVDEIDPSHLIIACGSAIKTLIEKGIQPDYAVVIDPNPDLSAYPTSCDLPVVFQPRASHAAIANFSGPKIYMGSSTVFPLEVHLFKQAGHTPYFFDAGWDAGTFGIQWAHHLGCKSVTTSGIDHSVTQRDFAQARRFLKGEISTPQPVASPAIQADISEIRKELNRLHALDESLPAAVVDAEMVTSFLNPLLFDPLWEVAQHFFTGDLNLHRICYIKGVIDAYVRDLTP